MILLKDVHPFPVWKRYDSEKYFEDPETGIKCPFPTLSDTPSVTLSVIVPAFNEEDRCEYYSRYKYTCVILC